MTAEPRRFSYESMGTHWAISIWDDIPEQKFLKCKRDILGSSMHFDQTYSRFIQTSLITQLSKNIGVVDVPHDLVSMLRLYERMHDASDGKFNPLVGFTLSDLGYDAEYSLQPKESIRPVPHFHDAITILDDTRIELHQTVLIDLGALGKGFFVDKIATYLRQQSIKRFLVDGSGDIYYSGNGEAIRIGLEHPGDTTKAIGVVELLEGSMCSSAGNRRRWKQFHHTIDPITLDSPHEVIATWVVSQTAAVADGLATCLFFTAPGAFADAWKFEYCILRHDYAVKRSDGFTAEMFS